MESRVIGTRSRIALVGALVIGAALAAPLPALAVTYTERTLPFVGLKSPVGVAVDPAGDVFATGQTNLGSPTQTGVMELPAGSSIPETLPFGPELKSGVAVDPAGDVFATEVARVAELPAGSTTQQFLPTAPLDSLGGNNVAVDPAGDVFVNAAGGTVMELSNGGSTWQTLPLSGLVNQLGVAVDAAGDVYVLEDLAGLTGAEVVELLAGSDRVETRGIIKAPGAFQPGLAVDPAGDVFVTSESPGTGQVFELPAGSSTPQVLPFTGLDRPEGVAADQGGDVFVADLGNNRVVELSPTSGSSGGQGGTGAGGGSGPTVTCVNTTNCTVIQITVTGTNTGSPTITYTVPSSMANAIENGTRAEALARVDGRTRVIGRGRFHNHRLVIHLTRLAPGRYTVTLIAFPAHRHARLLTRTSILIG